ncbi:aminotransferase class I/II-fold pyridoxal phosphate-dependent enzyme, partial [Bacillus pumilus]
NDVELRSVALNEDFSLPVEALLAAADKNSRLMWICSPNNPTGNSFSRADILRLADSFNGMVVVDEAYIDFSAEPSLLADIATHHNLIVM